MLCQRQLRRKRIQVKAYGREKSNDENNCFLSLIITKSVKFQ